MTLMNLPWTVRYDLCNNMIFHQEYRLLNFFLLFFVCVFGNIINRVEKERRRVFFPCSYGWGSYLLFTRQRRPWKPLTFHPYFQPPLRFDFLIPSVLCFYVSSLSWNSANPKEVWIVKTYIQGSFFLSNFFFLFLKLILFSFIPSNRCDCFVSWLIE